MKRPLSTRRIALFIAATAGTLVPVGPAKAGGFWFHKGHTYTSTFRTQSTGPILSGVGAAPLNFQVVAPNFQSGAVAPAPSPAPLPLSLSAPATYYVVPQGQATMQSFSLAPQGASPFSLSAGAEDVSNNQYVVQAAGALPIHVDMKRFVQPIKDELEKLIRGRGQGVGRVTLEAMLLDVTKGLFSASPGGNIIYAAIEPLLRQLIHKIVADRQAQSPADIPENPSNPPIPITPAGEQRYKVSGEIILTPVSGGTPTGPPAEPLTPAPAPTTDDGAEAAPPPAPGS